jgi:ribonuclease P protein component
MRTIKSRQEFGRVFSEGRRYNDHFVRICVQRDDEGSQTEGKVAFVAAKRLGNAVFRNRSKRVLREAARACGLPQVGTRIILFATPATAQAPTGRVRMSLERLLKRSGVTGEAKS